MKTVQETLLDRKLQSKGNLIGYFPAGYPTISDSVSALVELSKVCSVLEIGVPYSDPVMDGPVIQRATETALRNGFRLKDVFTVVSEVRAQTDTPILVMSYWNPILRYGANQFSKDLKEAGGQGLITPDLIPDEAEDWLSISDELELERVFLAAPSSSQVRVDEVAEKSKGFVYAVSTMGITGERTKLDELARSVVRKVRTASKIPTCVGVGVSNADQVREVNSYADGAIVGTAFIRAYEEGGISKLRDKVTELAEGLG